MLGKQTTPKKQEGMTEPWMPSIQKSFKQNYSASDTVKVPLASVIHQVPTVHPVVFQDFLESDDKVILLSCAANNADVMGKVKYGSQLHTLYWEMPKTKETWTLTGRIYVVAAPTLLHRFGMLPRKINLPYGKENAEEFWELERMKQWKRLSPYYRATFSWPASGEPFVDTEEPMQGLDVGFKYLSLEAIDPASQEMNVIHRGDGTISRKSTPFHQEDVVQELTRQEELNCVHNRSLDNFCLLVFKVSSVESVSFIEKYQPPTRHVYEYQESVWNKFVLNP